MAAHLEKPLAHQLIVRLTAQHALTRRTVLLEHATVAAQVVVLTQVAQDTLEVLDELLRREFLITALAATSLGLRTVVLHILVHRLIQGDPYTGRTFDNVEKFTKGNREQPHHDHHLVCK